MQPLSTAQRRWRRIRRGLKAAVAFAIIGMACVVAAASLALPWVVANPGRVQALLSDRLGQPVHFARITGQWRTSGPLLTLEEVAIGDGEAPFRVGRAALAIDLYAWLKPGVSISEFRLDGLEIEATREADGRWRIARLGGGAAGGDPRAVLDLADVVLGDARVRLLDAERGIGVAFARVDLKLAADGERRRIGGAVRVDPEGPPLRFACVQTAAVRCWLGGRALPVADWLALLPLGGVVATAGAVDLDAWYADGAAGERVDVALVARELRLAGTEALPFSDGDRIEPRARIPYWRVGVAARRVGAAWQLRVEDRRAPGPVEPAVAANLAIAADGSGRLAVADATADLAALAPLLALGDRLPAGLRGFLYESMPRGRVAVTRLARGDDGRWQGAIELGAVTLAPGSRTPGIGAVSGTVSIDGDALLYVGGREQSLLVDWPHVFRGAIPLALAAPRAAAWRDADGWRIALAPTPLSGRGFAGSAEATLWFDPHGRRPTLDARLAIDAGEVAAARQFWPVNVMPAPTVAWLDRALTSGRIEGGAAVLRGDLDDWPFRNGEGRFVARARAAAIDLDYHGRWPAARIASVDLEFGPSGLVATASEASTLDNRIGRATARIDDFANARLLLHVEGAGSGPALLDFVRASPINGYTNGYLASLEVGGSAEVSFDLDLPLKRALGEPVLAGSALLRDADLADRRWNLAFARANGRVRFSTRGLVTDDLSATWNGDPAQLSIAIGEFVVDPAHLLEGSARGEFPVTTVLAGATAIAPWFARLPGKSRWTMDLAVDRAEGDPARPRTQLRLTSDLVGTRLDLPAPLRKDAASRLPLTLTTRLPFAGQRLDVELGRLARLRMRLPDARVPAAARLAFGMAPDRDPEGPGLVVRGDVPALDVGGWAELAGAAAGTGGGAIDIDVRTAELAALSRAFPDMRVRIDRDAGRLRLRLDGPAAEGVLLLPRAEDALGIEADFTRLHLPDAPPGQVAQPVDPARLPPLHVSIGDLRLGSAALGRARIETAPLVDGLRVEVLETTADALSLRGTGEWRLGAAGERSAFDVRFEAASLGRMLGALGYAGIIDGGKCTVALNGSWSGPPAAFALARVTGTLSAEVGPGRILDVDPGAGRLLGLVSLQAIPRRLALDFSDFFQRGMSFDSITGSFELRAGDAYTAELAVKGPSADIVVSGRTGIARRDYDQELLVTPRVGGVLPVVGALAAGPVGAAAGLVAQGVLQAPLNQISRARYRVTGSWDEPRIDLIARERGARNPQG